MSTGRNAVVTVVTISASRAASCRSTAMMTRASCSRISRVHAADDAEVDEADDVAGQHQDVPRVRVGVK